jgi:nitrate/TMAO reductase-like tetraheme cytochrome c subunit
MGAFSLGQVVLVLILFVLPSGCTWAAEVQDSCVDCHSDRDFLVTNKKLYTYFQEWQQSIHKQEEIACSDCHGGNPKLSDKEGAHGADIAESNQKSAVNFRNIPETCGECHDDFLQAYRQSPHFEHLIAEKQEEQGPNCVTCHGSINSTVLNVNTVQEACERCHNDESENHPEIPETAKTVLNKFLSIHRFYRYITVKGDPSESKEFFQNIGDRVYKLSVNWHAFDLDAVEESTGALLDLLKKKRDEVRKRTQKSREL